MIKGKLHIFHNDTTVDGDYESNTIELDIGDPLFAYEFAVAKLWRLDYTPRSVSWMLYNELGEILASEDKTN